MSALAPNGVYAVDMAAPAGIAQVIDTWDGSAADYDNDGCTDVLINRHTATPGLYHNNCNGTFTEVLGAFPHNDHHSQAWGDFNGDGLLDLYWAVGGGGGIGVTNKELWIQQPDHTFVNQAIARGVNERYGRGRGAAAIDVNHDGKLDLFVANKSPRNDQMVSPNRMYLNQGSTFTDAAWMGLDIEQSIEAYCLAVDYNADGWQDLLIVGEHQAQLLRNDSGTGFTDVSRAVKLPIGPARAAQVVDMNGDGLLDLVIMQSKLQVYLQRAGVFNLAYTRSLSSPRALAVGDVNGDGFPDVYVVEGNNKNSAADPDVMLVNDGTGAGFTTLPTPQVTTGSGDDVWAVDYDNNGLTDFVVLNGAFGTTAGPVQLIAFFPNPPGGAPQPTRSGFPANNNPAVMSARDTTDAATATPIPATASTAAAAMGAPTLISATPAGGLGNGLSFRSSVSSGGRYVAFESFASNLVSGDTNLWPDIFVRDTQTGTTVVASVGVGGAPANGPSGTPAISDDGRYVAFYSSATNLVTGGDTNQRIDVFVRDLQTGTTTRVSVASDGTEANNESSTPSISADGRYVAFTSLASNLVPRDTNNKYDAFVHDMLTGTTTVVSVTATGAVGNYDSIQPALSSTGRYVAFASQATNLVAGKTKTLFGIFLRDLQTGTTTWVDRAAVPGQQANGSALEPSISADGHRVAFISTATNLTSPPGASAMNVYVRDLVAGTTVLASPTATGGVPSGRSYLPHLSDDGRTVVFMSEAKGLVTTDTDGNADVFLRDLGTNTTYRLSTTTSGAALGATASAPSATPDNRYVIWASATTKLIPNASGVVEVYERDFGSTP